MDGGAYKELLRLQVSHGSAVVNVHATTRRGREERETTVIQNILYSSDGKEIICRHIVARISLRTSCYGANVQDCAVAAGCWNIELFILSPVWKSHVMAGGRHF